MRRAIFRFDCEAKLHDLVVASGWTTNFFCEIPKSMIALELGAPYPC